MSGSSEIGIIGMGVMGKSLALNFASKGIAVSVYNRHVPEKEVNIASGFAQEYENTGPMQGFDTLDDFFKSLVKPRKVLMMITAGPAIDSTIKELLPFLKHGDVLMDGGNSFYEDTTRRQAILHKSDIHYLGMGISGGEEGALKGPSLMPGGDKAGYDMVEDLIRRIAAKDQGGNPCCAYLGTGGAGHFIKMIHNGIEYAEMQLLAEVYDLLKRVFNLPNDKIADFLENAPYEAVGGFLTDATIEILRFKEGDQFLVDKIMDTSEQKGTGSWTMQAALNEGIPLSTISEAVMARFVSSLKDKRVRLAEKFNISQTTLYFSDTYKDYIIRGLHTARLINHLSGFDFIHAVANENKWEVSLAEVARIWTNGCIIRSGLMEELSEVYKEGNEAWGHDKVMNRLNHGSEALAEVISAGMKNGIPLPVMCASLNLFYGISTANSTANLIQAQRDFFGSHTYQRTDKPKNDYFHTEWTKK